jgi:hypothetical protein
MAQAIYAHTNKPIKNTIQRNAHNAKPILLLLYPVVSNRHWFYSNSLYINWTNNWLWYIRYWARGGKLNIDQDGLSFFPNYIYLWWWLIILLFILWQAVILNFSFKRMKQGCKCVFICAEHFWERMMVCFSW